MTQRKPVFVVIAGVNGAGKSTFHHAHLRQVHQRAGITWVNPDDILRELGGDPTSQSNQLQAAKISVRRLHAALDAQRSLCEETTLAGTSCLSRMKKAKDNGFSVILHYLGVSHPEIAQARIRNRVSMGGHSIPDDVVAKRYRTSLANLDKAIRLCDEAYAFDNTTKLTQWASWSQGCLTSWDVFPIQDNWLYNAISEEEIAY